MKYISHLIWFVAVLVAFSVGKEMSKSPAVGGVRDEVKRVAADLPENGRKASGLTALGEAGDGGGTGAMAKIFAKPVIAVAVVEDALGRALHETDPLLRKQQIATILAGLDAENVGAALAAFEAGPRGGDHDSEFRDFLHAWARIDGAAAIAYAMDEKSPRRDHYGGSYVMSGWAMADADAAKGYLAGVENEHAKEWLHYGVVTGLMNTDLDAAVAFSEQNKLGRARGRQMDRLADRFFETGGSAAVLSWLNGIDHTAENNMLPYKRYSAKVAMERIARSDPKEARAWVESNAGAPFVSGEAVATVASHHAREDYQQRVDWISSLPEGDSRGDALSIQVREWAQKDANAAGEWLGANLGSPDYDKAAGSFADEIEGQDPESALAWVGTIQSAEVRQGAEARVLQNWQKRAPEAAAQWLQANRP